ncbi:MAG: Gfo/Idh/MocA family oxidoreductase [Pirellulales bacterium]|nr:Gfo/Idh/MocA family oxidoreductase [Pirellulales bacterium]
MRSPSATRRSFLKTSSVAMATTLAIGANIGYGANNKIRVGLLGCGAMGNCHGDSLKGQSDSIDLVYVCDPDNGRRDRARNKIGARKSVSDPRTVLDDKSVDAIFIATPDHWHAPLAILGCQAGKHVYVEKPCSHNIHEASLLRKVAKETGKVVQHGTQSRSQGLVAEGMQMLKEGIIGDVLIAKAWNIQRRGVIGKQKPSDPPAGVDYDMWVGPAEFVPFQENRFHSNWRWWHNFGTGDLGNDGMHEIDYARWGLGVEGLPSRAAGLGGHLWFNDDQQFPDTANVVFEYAEAQKEKHKPKQLIVEMRLWTTNYPHNVDGGAEFYGTKGQMFLSKRGKIQVLAERNRRIDNPKPKDMPQLSDHRSDFFDAIRNDRQPRANMDVAFDSVVIPHYANIAVRIGKSFEINPNSGVITNNDEANALIARKYREGGHWAVPTT